VSKVAFDVSEVFAKFNVKALTHHETFDLIRQSWYGRHRNPIHAHHVTKVGDKEFINWQVLAMDKEKDKFWATVEEEDGGIFDCLGMFQE
jgi:hypothetical protein